MGQEQDFHYDELLVIRSQQGEVAAFEELVERWQQRLWRYARLQTGDDMAAWDVVQETWVAVVSHIRRLDNPRSFGAWVYRIAGTASATWHRQRSRHRRLQHRYRQEHPRSDSSADQDEAFISSLVQKALEDLSPDHLAVVSLYYGESVPIRHIAQMLDLPEGTVKSRLFHARERLRKTLRKDGND